MHLRNFRGEVKGNGSRAGRCHRCQRRRRRPVGSVRPIKFPSRNINGGRYRFSGGQTPRCSSLKMPARWRFRSGQQLDASEGRAKFTTRESCQKFQHFAMRRIRCWATKRPKRLRRTVASSRSQRAFQLTFQFHIQILREDLGTGGAQAKTVNCEIGVRRTG